MMQIKGTTRIAGVIGWPVEHSRSPQILNRAFEIAGIDAVLVPIGVAPAGFAPVIAGLRAMRALGASVTVPHKLAAEPDRRAIDDEIGGRERVAQIVG
jgi:shikimate dehydrogenase